MNPYQKVALIPARMGSERVKDKNIYEIDGHPLLAYSVSSAIDSNIFDKIVCVTDSPLYAEIAEHYGACVPSLRPSETSTSTAPDILWVKWILEELESLGEKFDIFSILRPTSPLRSPNTIIDAFKQFIGEANADSIRAVQLCSEHPGKMWEITGSTMVPLIDKEINGIPWHSNQYKALPKTYIQNASLEFAWTNNIYENNSISGQNIIPFITREYEGFDINYPQDFYSLEGLIQENKNLLKKIKTVPFKERKK